MSRLEKKKAQQIAAKMVAAAEAAEKKLSKIAKTRRPTDEEMAEARKAYRAAAIALGQS